MSYGERIISFFRGIFSGVNLSSFGIPNIGLNTIIDILAVAFISYNVLLWIKETRAWSLFKGIIVIFLISMISYLFELYTISWIISGTLNFGILAVVIIFQPEMRKALEQLGKGRFMQFLNPVDKSDNIVDRTVEEIIAAAEKMAKARTGAIIVIEKQVALGDLERSGIPIDAIVSSQLLINIFENKTPLHDGAVIIRNNRISAASCILPLTQTEISPDLGTRHRAAIGASEVSDAFILVVSEETGTVSMASSGNLYRNLKANDIRDMLVEDIKPSKRNRSLWKGRKND